MRDYKPKYSTAKKQHAYKECKISVQNFEDVVYLQKCVVYKTYYDQNLRYHCPVFVVLNFDKHKQILHTRSRTGCSALRYYLYNRNLVSDALCHCGTIENNFHFLLECRRYNVMRREMLQTVSRFADVSERVLLYGDSNLSDTDNELVFKAVHKYIKQTKRFSSGN